jgi:SH3 domain protein
MERRFFIAILIIIALLTAAVLPAQAQTQTRYVSDEITINLRTGKGEQFRILRMLRVGTPMEVLEDDDERYVLVRTRNGEEGYVLKQYLTSEMPKAVLVERLTQERDRLRTTLGNLEGNRAGLATEMNELRERVSTLEQELVQSERSLKTVQSQYSDLQEKSKNVVALTEERDRLLAENVKYVSEVEILKGENEQLLVTGMIQWFLAGGGVFLVGWMIGKISRKKKRGY